MHQYEVCHRGGSSDLFFDDHFETGDRRVKAPDFRALQPALFSPEHKFGKVNHHAE
jgi:hypothetical protein